MKPPEMHDREMFTDSRYQDDGVAIAAVGPKPMPMKVMNEPVDG